MNQERMDAHEPRIVTLPPDVVEFCRQWAQRRLDSKISPPRWHANGMSLLDSHFIGCLGEKAAGIVYECPVNTSISPHGDGHAPDLKTWDGRELEVKAITWMGPRPLIKLCRYEFRGDVEYVLVQVKPPNFAKVYPGIKLASIIDHGDCQDFAYGYRITMAGEQILELVGTESFWPNPKPAGWQEESAASPSLPLYTCPGSTLR